MEVKKALCVGINYYERASKLRGCVYDAQTVAEALSYNTFGGMTLPNFQAAMLLGEDEESPVTVKDLRGAVEELFKGDPDVALLYYSGHGAVDSLGGYLCTSEICEPRDGLSLEEVMRIAGNSKAKNKIIILDSCHSGAAANISQMSNYCLLPSGTVILSACGEKEYAVEKGYHGVFTSLLLQALEGGAMDLLGQVSPGSIYSYIDQSLGAWDQRPVFKANIKNFVCLKQHNPLISRDDLRKIAYYFPRADYKYPLDPTYEEDKNYTDNKEVNKEHEAIFALLREYHKLNLVVPVDEKYMYWAAIHSTGCKLTPLGQHYHRIARKGLI